MRIVVCTHVAAVCLRHGRHGNEKYAAPVTDTTAATAATTHAAAAPEYSNTTGTTAATGAVVIGSAAAAATAAAGTSAAQPPSATSQQQQQQQQQPYSTAARSTPNVIVSGTAFGGLNRSDSNRTLSATHVGDVAGGPHRGGLGKHAYRNTSHRVPL
jgi:hypothetical protein